MPYDKERVARRLKSLRVDAGMEQADLTEALGCTLEQLVCRDEGRVA